MMEHRGGFHLISWEGKLFAVGGVGYGPDEYCELKSVVLDVKKDGLGKARK